MTITTTQVKDFVVKNLALVVIGVLIALLFFKNCSPSPMKPEITVVRDTVWISHDTTIYSKPEVIAKIVPKHDTLPPQYLPDTNYANLKTQYEQLRDDYLSLVIQKDSLNISDTAGMKGLISVTDTSQSNKIIGRKWDYSITYPKTKETITIKEPYKPRNQLFIGGDIRGNKTSPFSAVDVGLMLKNKADNMGGVSVGITTAGTVEYMLHYYHKISLRRQN